MLEKLYTESVPRPWYSCPEAVGAPSLEALKARLDRALGSLSWWGTALPTAGVGAEWGCEVPSNSNHSVIL